MAALDQDGAEPSPNSVAVNNLIRLSYFLDEPNYRDMAVKTVKAFGKHSSLDSAVLQVNYCAVTRARENLGFVKIIQFSLLNRDLSIASRVLIVSCVKVSDC